MATATAKKQLVPVQLGECVLENIMKLRGRIHVPLNGRDLTISGANGQGKTSFVRALSMRLGCKPVEDPISHGENEARIKTSLIDADGDTVLIVEQVFRRDGKPSLEIYEPDGRTKYTSRPAELLDRLRPKDSVGLRKFLQWCDDESGDDKELVKFVLKTCGVSFPKDEVEKIIGESVSIGPGETASETFDRLLSPKIGKLYIERREANRVKEQKIKALEDRRQSLGFEAGEIEDEEPEQSMKALADEYEDLKKQDDLRVALRRKADASAADLANGDKKIKQLEVERDRLKAELARIEGLLDTGDKAMIKLRSRAKADEAQWANAPDVTNALMDLRERMSQLDSANRDIKNRNRARQARVIASQEIERLQVDAKGAADEWSRLCILMDRVSDKRAECLENFNIGIDGLSVSESEVLLNGVSLRQASHAEKVIVFVCLEAKLDYLLKVLWLDGAESLDDRSLAKIKEIAHGVGIELIVTFVERHGDLKWEVVDE